MNQLREYARLRAKGWRASEAWRAAKVHAAFSDLEDEGLVRIQAEPDDMPAKTIEPDFNGLNKRKCDAERERKAWWKLVEQEGVWVYFAQWRLSEDECWETADSIAGFVGSGDFQDSGYDVDLKGNALDALAEAREGLAETERRERQKSYVVENPIAEGWA